MAGALRTARAAAAASACLVAAAVAGCGGGAGVEPVSVQVFADPAEVEVYRDLARAHERRSGRQVDLVEVGDRRAHHQKLTSAFGAGDPPDVFLVNYRNFGGFVAKGAIDPAGPRLKASRVLRRKAFYPQALDSFTLDGELQCMPQNVSSPVVDFNRDAFGNAGLPDPRPNWTYDDLVETAQSLRQAAPERDPIGFEPGIIRLAPFVWSTGGELVDDSNQPTGFTLDTAAARRGLEAFFRLARFGPTEVEVEARPFEERFINGELAMLISSRRDVPAFRTIDSFDWDVAPLPPVARPASVLHSDAYCLAKGGNPAAWDFVEFAIGPQGQRLAARAGRIVPSLKAVARSKDFLAPEQRPRAARVFLQAIPHLRRLPNTPAWSQVEDVGNGVVEEAFFEAAALHPRQIPEVVEEFSRSLNRETSGSF